LFIGYLLSDCRGYTARSRPGSFIYMYFGMSPPMNMTDSVCYTNTIGVPIF
jgi:hypothetical protein